MSTREGEGKSHRKLLIFDILLLHEVAEAICHVAEELKTENGFSAVKLNTASQVITCHVYLTLTEFLMWDVWIFVF